MQEASITLEERPGEPIGEIGILVESRNGDLLIGDPMRTQIRRYSAQGKLLRTSGRYGEGPFEFRRIAGLIEDNSGHVVAVDPKLGRVTILDSNLTPDGVVTPSPIPRGTVVRAGTELLFATASGPRSTSFTMFANDWRVRWAIPAQVPGTMFEYPYWNSFALNLVDASPKYIVTAYSLRYPILIRNIDGTLLDSITAPSGFRPAPVVKAGAFTGPDGGKRQDEWFATFDVISNLALVDNDYLVITHGVLRRTETSLAWNEHRRVDIYDLGKRSMLAADVQLPKGVRVLCGGEKLYIMLEEPPGQWRLGRMQLREPDRS